MWQQLKNIYHLLVAFVASAAYGFPARRMLVVGVTGTDGKTTTASLIYHILEKNGKKVALISTIGASIAGREYKTGFHVTTPGSFALQAYLRKSVVAHVEYVVIEVTSHALDQNRIFGIPFALGVITNITHEHLDYHKSYEQYAATKMKLLDSSRVGVVNKDDESYNKISKIKSQKSNLKLITFGKENADITFKDIASWETSLLGEYNKHNILAAAAVCEELGLSLSAIQKAVASFVSPRGRAEIVYENDFAVMIDFAHTPNALEQLLKTIKKMKKEGRIILVFGCAGKRDKRKRPMMGEVASHFADVIVLTAEDPRGEPVSTIIDEIASGVLFVGYSPQVDKIPDRQEAILHAIQLAKKDDLIVITGKGHEESMNYGRGEVAWTDHEAVKKALSKKHEA